MKNILLWGLFLSLFSACVVPVNTSFESARMLKKGDIEMSGHYSHYVFKDNGESQTTNNNYGARVGYGINNKFNVKLRYERLIAPSSESTSSYGLNYIDLAPKFQLLPGKIAGTLPIGLYFDESDTKYVISPKLLFTYPARDKFEATLAAKADIFPQDGGDVYLGFNLGLGVSSNLNRWALRPELGLMVKPGDSGVAWSYGIGLCGILPAKWSRDGQ